MAARHGNRAEQSSSGRRAGLRQMYKRATTWQQSAWDNVDFGVRTIWRIIDVVRVDCVREFAS